MKTTLSFEKDTLRTAAIASTDLDSVVGGTRGTQTTPVDGSGAPNPARLKLGPDGGPLDNAANNKLAAAWNKQNHIGAARGGNFGPDDGQHWQLYRYEYANGSRFAPGADD
jgi:hypothetical protein